MTTLRIWRLRGNEQINPDVFNEKPVWDRNNGKNSLVGKTGNARFVDGFVETDLLPIPNETLEQEFRRRVFECKLNGSRSFDVVDLWAMWRSRLPNAAPPELKNVGTREESDRVIAAFSEALDKIFEGDCDATGK